MLKPSFYNAAAVAILSTSLPSFAQEAQEQNTSGQTTYSDWLVTCTDEQTCRMTQTVVQPSTNRLITQVKVFPGEKQPTMLVSFPLGILLSPGWYYQVDNKPVAAIPFEICNDEGCHAGVPLSSQMVSQLKRGNELKITFYDAAKEKVEPKISLIGFTKAFEALQ